MSSSSRRTACFFTPLRDRSQLRTIEFYAQDLDILDELGFDVRVATRWKDIPWDSDLYFIWWWTWAFQPLIKAKLRGRPTLITGTVDNAAFVLRPWYERMIMRGSAFAADWNVMVSELEWNWLRDDVGVPHVSYIPHAVDSRTYVPGAGPREDFCFTVCNMVKLSIPRKCMLELIEAIPIVRREFPHLTFLIAGDLADGGDEVVARAEQLGLDGAVEFLGRISVSEKIRLMQTCMLYLQPTRFEGFGLATAEAMSCGAPVVTSPTGAVPEVVGGCGEYVDGTEPRSIAEGVIRLARDPDLRRRRSSAGRERIEREFSMERRRDGLAALIESLMNRDPERVKIARSI